MLSRPLSKSKVYEFSFQTLTAILTFIINIRRIRRLSSLKSSCVHLAYIAGRRNANWAQADSFDMQFAFILPICKMNVVEVVDTIFLTERNTCHKENSISIDKHKEMNLVWSKKTFLCQTFVYLVHFCTYTKVITLHSILCVYWNITRYI